MFLWFLTKVIDKWAKHIIWFQDFSSDPLYFSCLRLLVCICWPRSAKHKLIQVNPRGKKTKFSSSFYTLFREGTDNKHEVQFKGRPTPEGYQSTLRWTRTWFQTLSRYGTRPSLPRNNFLTLWELSKENDAQKWFFWKLFSGLNFTVYFLGSINH